MKDGSFLSHLSSTAVEDFEAVKVDLVYPRSSALFLEGHEPRGVFLLLEGLAKLSTGSSDGRTLILRIASPGEVLGLAAVLSGDPYEVTAEALHPCQVAFLRRNDFLRFVREHPEALREVTRQLTANYKDTFERLKTLGLSPTALGKLARLLLEWSATGQQTREGTRITLSLTHEEMAEVIGTSRETVTRTLSEFRQRRLVALRGATLMIPSREALEDLVTA